MPQSGNDIERVQQFIDSGKKFHYNGREIVPFDAEKELNQLGMSQGFVHFRYTDTGKISFCGVSWFCKHIAQE